MSRAPAPSKSAHAPAPRPAADVVAGVDLSDDARKALRPDATGTVFFDDLVKANLQADATRVMARLLTPKQAVWWGCLCVWQSARPHPSPDTEAAVRAAVKWLREPTDPNRRAAGADGKAAGFATAAGLVATAAFLSDGSMSGEGHPEVKPDPHLTAKLVSEAVLLLARQAGPAKTAPLLRQYLAIAVDVYRGSNTWLGKA